MTYDAAMPAGTPSDMPEVIKAETPVDGFLLFEKHADGKLTEILRTLDISRATSTADYLCRAWPGVTFYLYSGVTGKWYAYLKPII